MSRREYPLKIFVNRVLISKVIIDPHFEEKHSESINDEIILQLALLLDGNEYVAEVDKNNFSYFATNLVFNKKNYRLIWLLEKNEIYIGIVNAYRR